MKGFIEVTEGKRKVLLAISEIKVVIKTRKDNAVISLKEYYRPLFNIDGEIIICKESYDEVKALIAKAAAE